MIYIRKTRKNGLFIVIMLKFCSKIKINLLKLCKMRPIIIGQSYSKTLDFLTTITPKNVTHC